MKRIALLAVAFMAAFNLSAQRMNIIFETDRGNDVDDALAIDMLYKYHKQGRIRLMAVMINKEGEYPPQYIDLLNTWYGQKRIPIGGYSGTKQSVMAGNNYTVTICNAKNEKGKPLYKRSIKDYSTLPSSVELYRRLLSKAADQSVTIVSVGFSTNLALLLETNADEYSPLRGRELVAQKVSRLVMMAGHMKNPTFTEYNVVNEIPACQKVYREWPTPIYTSPFELGLEIKYPASSIENDFGWTVHHPIVDSYKAYLPQIEDRPTWDLTAVLYAIDPQDFFTVSPPGRITVTDEGNTHYKSQPDGTHYYLSVTPDQAHCILDYFVAKITKKP